uniref:Uncharacterized protein n=1 Tax=Panagrolaimus davidi TaxID=227884 RepID=A0A914Q5F3_9BILA
MFRTATYKPAICDCDVFREEGDHQNRNAFTLLIYGIAITFIAALFLTVVLFRDTAEIRQYLYEPCNKSDILTVKEVKDLIQSKKMFKGMAENLAWSRNMMKDANLAFESLLGKAAMEEQEKKMENEFYKPLTDNLKNAENNLNRQISERKKCAEENFHFYIFKSFLRISSAIGLIAIFLTLLWFIFLFIISTQFFKSKFTGEEYFKVQSRSHKLFVLALISMILFVVIMYSLDIYESVYENTFEKALNK